MAGFNHKKTSRDLTVNHEQHKAFALNTLEIYFNKCLSSFFGEKSFYENNNINTELDELLKHLQELSESDKKYLLKIAVIGRRNGMRTFPIVLFVSVMNHLTDRSIVAEYHEILSHPRDLLEAMAIQVQCFGKPIPNQLKKLMKEKLEGFSATSLSKSLGNTKSFSLADVIKLVHPDPKKAKSGQKFFKKVIEGKVKFGNGRKTIQNSLTSQENNFKESVEQSSLFAIVKNIKAIVSKDNDPDTLKAICKKLESKEDILNSKILPFRFFSAFKELSSTFDPTFRKVLPYLDKAINLSIENMPEIRGSSVILIDTSGSMGNGLSSLSNVRYIEVGAMLGAILQKKCEDSVIITFANDANILNTPPHHPVSSFVDTTVSRLGGGTYLIYALEKLQAMKQSFDNLFIISDGDVYGYTNDTSFGIPEDKIINDLIAKRRIQNMFSLNLAGNKTSFVNYNNHKHFVTGFSEHILTMISLYSDFQGHYDIYKIIDKLYNK